VTKAICAAQFCQELKLRNFGFFTGVPDSLLQDFCACLTKSEDSNKHVISANEGNSIGLAAGYYLSTGTYGVAYFQNSGLGNAINPLLSLADEDVYSIPMLLILGWRGEPGTKDEPQHVKQGKVTLPLLDTMGIPYRVLDEDFEAQLDWAAKHCRENSSPVALVVRKGSFAPYPFEAKEEDFPLTRESALKVILDSIRLEDLTIATTGKTAREIFELRVARGEGHANDFLTVGSMGHTASIALGISLGTDKNVYCIDGDGSFLMHMGSMATVADLAESNFKYILNNNGAHESVGGQPTIARSIDIEAVLRGLGFAEVFTAKTSEEIEQALVKMSNQLSLCALIIDTRQGSRKDLGRPTQSPQQNKTALMEKIQERVREGTCK